MRLTTKGARQVSVASERDVYKFMCARVPGCSPTFPQVWQFWKTIDAAAMRDFMGTFSAWTGTVGEGDVLALPPAFIVAEKAVGGVACGLRRAFVCCGMHAGVRDSVVEVFEDVSNELGKAPSQSNDKTRNVIEQVIKILKSKELPPAPKSTSTPLGMPPLPGTPLQAVGAGGSPPPGSPKEPGAALEAAMPKEVEAAPEEVAVKSQKRWAWRKNTAGVSAADGGTVGSADCAADEAAISGGAEGAPAAAAQESETAPPTPA